MNSTSFERTRTSAELRNLLPSLLDGDADSAMQWQFTYFVVRLAGGNEDLALKATEQFFGDLLAQGSDVSAAVASTLLSSFLAGEIDLVGLSEKGEFLWQSTSAEAEARQ